MKRNVEELLAVPAANDNPSAAARNKPATKERGVIVRLPPPDAEGVRRFARLLVEWAAVEVLDSIEPQNNDAAELAGPTASEEKVT